MTKQEIDEFIAFVGEGGEVNLATLDGLVNQAEALITLRIDETLIGTAAIKRPHDGYRQGAFRKAGVGALAQRFPLELGWVVVHRDHRRQGHARALVKGALAAVPLHAIYSTTKSDPMRRILPEFGFALQGHAYKSAILADGELSLFGRLASGG
jgi:predicted GNAT family N-acyltransferase